MKKFVKFFIPLFIVFAVFAGSASFAGQEILIPYALTDDNWASGLAITNMSDETISQLAIDFYPSDGSFDVATDRTVIESIGPHEMIVEQASKLYPGGDPPTDTYSLRLFHNGDQDFGVALFVLNLAQGFGFQQFMSDDFTSMNGDGSAMFMAVHASPDAPDVDILLDGFTAAEALGYPNNTGYLQAQVGNRLVEIVVSGTDTTVYQDTLTPEANSSYSLFAIDEVANLDVLVLKDDLSDPASGFAHVRFIHLSPDAPAVDVTLTDGTVLFENFSFKDGSAFAPFAAGPVTLQVRLTGTETVVLELDEIELQDGGIYTIFARGFLEGTEDQALGAEIITNK